MKADVDDSRRYLLCRIGRQLCGLSLEHVLETMRPLPIDRLVGASGFVVGMAVIRGEPVPVVDGARLLTNAHAGPPSRFVSLELGERRVALGVDEVLGVRAVERLRELPPLLAGAPADLVSEIGLLDQELLFVLREARLFSEEPEDIPRSAA